MHSRCVKHMQCQCLWCHARVLVIVTPGVLQSHGQWDPNPKLFLSLHVRTLMVIPGGVRPPPCPNRTKHSPSLSSRCSPAFITLGWTVRVQIEWLPTQPRVVVLFVSTGNERWQTGPYTRGQSFCSRLNQLSQHLRPSPKPGSPWSSYSPGDEDEYPSSHTFGKHATCTLFTCPISLNQSNS
jgi:hypothetical protein